MVDIEIMGVKLPDETCEFCGHWVKQTKKNLFDLESGFCKRHAPQPVVQRLSEHDENEFYYPHWPSTFPTDGCGEWVDKDDHYREQMRRTNKDKNPDAFTEQFFKNFKKE